MGFEDLDLEKGKEKNIKKERVKQQIKRILGEIIEGSQREARILIDSGNYEEAKSKAEQQIELIKEIKEIEILVDRNDEESLKEIADKIRVIEMAVDFLPTKDDLGKIADKIESIKNIEEVEGFIVGEVVEDSRKLEEFEHKSR